MPDVENSHTIRRRLAHLGWNPSTFAFQSTADCVALQNEHRGHGIASGTVRLDPRLLQAQMHCQSRTPTALMMVLILVVVLMVPKEKAAVVVLATHVAEAELA